jgi:hypothetical protein
MRIRRKIVLSTITQKSYLSQTSQFRKMSQLRRPVVRLGLDHVLRGGVVDLKGVADTELAVSYVFCWFMEARQSPFLYATCIQILSHKLIKYTRLYLVLDGSTNNNNARTLKKVSTTMPGH